MGFYLFYLFSEIRTGNETLLCGEISGIGGQRGAFTHFTYFTHYPVCLCVWGCTVGKGEGGAHHTCGVVFTPRGKMGILGILGKVRKNKK